MTFCSVSLPSAFLHPLEAQHGDLGLLHLNDVLLLISNSGQTREVLDLEALARRLIPSLKIVAITGKKNSQLAKKSNYVLWTGDLIEACPLGLTPTTSTTCISVVGDVLAVLVVQMSGYGVDDYALRHHSGYLGSKAKGSDI
ncbi:D-arabinose 5-phosphate isomerase GutQ [Polynucleobacter sphagniphilus]|nr:D-arabinose 5-phosphate isomerase GutQ [Polynucleobacter sphagniphilus]